VQLGSGLFSVSYEFYPRQEDEAETRYGLVDEERKININKAAQATLKSFFETAGKINQQKATELSACIIDWRDVDEAPLENGAESSYYMGLNPPYPCKNAEFQRLDELLQVKGMTQEIFDATKNRMTIFGLGPVNINTADIIVLRSLGLSQVVAEKIINYRNGSDGEEATSDDNVFESLSIAAETLQKTGSFSAAEISEFSGIINANLLTVRSDNFSGRSTGRISGRANALNIDFTFNRNKILEYWRED